MIMEALRNRVTVEFRQHLAIVSLSREEKYNGLDLDMMYALIDAAKLIRRQRDVRAVILRGDGKAFCAGLDFATVMRKPAGILLAFLPWLRKDNVFQRMCLVWRDLPVPVIAVTHGYCFGGGMQLALACDFRFSTPDCQFSIMEIQWGLIPDMSASVTLRELVAADVAMELTMTGRKFDASEAKSLGLISAVATDPMPAAEALAAQIAERSPHAISAAKRLFRSTGQSSERGALARERRLQLALLLGGNQREAMRANFEKRPPVFRPR
jgi:enoyl-CoA hydratase/carnithine racemase